MNLNAEMTGAVALDRSRSLWPEGRLWVVLFIAVVVVLSTAVILRQDGHVPPWPMDQAFVTTADLHIGRDNGVWYFHYPNLQWAGGITASLAAGLYKLVIPAAPEHLNHHIKIFAMLLFFASGYLLAGRYLKTLPGSILFIALLASSGFQLIEPTNDLFAGIYLAIFLYGMAKGWNAIFTMFFLVCFGLCKAELPPVAGGMMLYCVWVAPSRNLKMLVLCSFFLWALFFIAPGLYLFGPETVGGGRAFPAAFSDHYVILMTKYKLLDISVHADLGNPDFGQIINRDFPGAKSLFDVAIRYPQKYFAYVCVTALTNVLVFFRTFKSIVGVLALRWMFFGKKRIAGHYELLMVICFVLLLVPHTFVAAFRARYLLKLFIPIVLMSVIYWEYCHEKSNRPVYARQSRIIFVLLILTIVLQVPVLTKLISNPYALEFIG